MEHSYWIPFFMFMVLFIILRSHDNAAVNKLMNQKRGENNTEMTELAKRFIGKECIIYSFNGNQYTGTIKEVCDGAVLVENDGNTEAINLDFIVRLREHPRNKKGKKKSVVLD